MPRKTFRVRRGDSIVEVDPNGIVTNPIQHPELTDEMLTRISAIYGKLREVISFQGNRMSLEAFEIMFMREIDVLSAIDIWEKVGMGYEKACDYFPEDVETRKTIYQWIILLVMGAVTEEEMRLNEVKIIQSCFASACTK